MNDNLDFLSFPMYMSRMSLFEALPASEGATVFVGDSLTQRNQWHEFFPGLAVLNRGIDSDRSLGVLRRLDQIIALKPASLFLMIGINDVYDRRDPNHILTNYETIIRRIKTELPGAKLFIQSLLPVNHSVYGHPVNNDDVKRMNDKLAELAEINQVVFIDLFSKVLKGGEMDEKYTVDGCHLSGQGYMAWVEIIKPFLIREGD
ncbi:GDSL-type esterase/lipase family protein [Paenibacillus thermotolerans]|uniref:GDSL-type esterase/lipase family protein n=1 Tax=Paenibacillus thermotolerans TaxID=3027807 RepID=UPI002367FA66|nr:MULTISPECIES: GDSL-type esterase/lipase family protein [unclassified Paenibacillus]